MSVPNMGSRHGTQVTCCQLFVRRSPTDGGWGCAQGKALGLALGPGAGSRDSGRKILDAKTFGSTQHLGHHYDAA